MNVLLVVLFSSVLIAAMILVAFFQMNFLADRIVGNKHREIEFIHTTGEVPVSWSKGFLRRLERLKKRGMPKRVGGLVERAKHSYVKKISSLIEYLERTPVISEEDVRSTLVEDLKRVRVLWENRPAGDFH
jgi:hypothetical protein